MKRKISLILIVGVLLALFCFTPVVQAGFEITLDDSTPLFTATDGSYYAKIPAGHPRIPLVLCDSAEEIKQATIPENENIGYASVVIGEEKVVVKFIKTEEKGFALQYDDHYEYDFGLSGDVTYTSSNSDIIEVSDGVLVVKAVSDEDVVITASNNTAEKTLTVTETQKAPINIMLVIGQSNSEGIAGDSSLSVKPKPGIGYNFCAKIHGTQATNAAKQEIYDNYYEDFVADTGLTSVGNSAQNCIYQHSLSKAEDDAYTGDKIVAAEADHANKLIDMSEGWRGFQNAYASEYYMKTGEKSLAVLGGVGGSAMFEWYPEYNDGKLGAYLYKNIVSKYDDAVALLGDNYEIRNQGYFWIQGEADMIVWANYLALPKRDVGCDTRAVYKNRLLSMHNSLKNELGMEYGAIFVVRFTNNYSKEYSTLHPVRVAQFEAAAENDDIYIATDLCEHIPNLMSDNGFHYDQNGYNNIGLDAAENMLMRNSPLKDYEAEDIAVYLNYSHIRADKDGVISINPLDGRKEGTKKATIAFVTYPIAYETDNFSIEYDKDSGLTIEDGTITVTDDFTQTQLYVTSGDLKKTYTVRNVNYEKQLEARYDESENLIYVSGKAGKLSGDRVGISLVHKETSDIEYIDQVEVDKNGCIDCLISFSGDISDYTVNISTSDDDYINNTDIVLNIAEISDSIDISYEVVLNSNTDNKDENAEDDSYTYSINYDFTSAFKRDIKGTLMCACYDKNGVLIGVDVNPITVEALNGAKFTENVNFRASTVKVFVMDEESMLIPLTNDVITIKR